jgi:hypothetical protein
MKKFKNYHLTDAEWKEVFSFPKEFNKGDVVECRSVINPELFVWKVIELMSYKKGDDVIYKVKSLLNGTLACFSSTFLQPLGTFVDTEFFTKGAK